MCNSSFLFFPQRSEPLSSQWQVLKACTSSSCGRRCNESMKFYNCVCQCVYDIMICMFLFICIPEVVVVAASWAMEEFSRRRLGSSNPPPPPLLLPRNCCGGWCLRAAANCRCLSRRLAAGTQVLLTWVGQSKPRLLQQVRHLMWAQSFFAWFPQS